MRAKIVVACVVIAVGHHQLASDALAEDGGSRLRGGGVAPLPGLGLTQLGKVFGTGGLAYLVWRRRRTRTAR